MKKLFIAHIDKEAIRISDINTKGLKPIDKMKLGAINYYVYKDDNYIYVKEYRDKLGSIFNISLLKDSDFMSWQRLYNEVLNEYNGLEYVHSQYVTSSILDKVYSIINSN